MKSHKGWVEMFLLSLGVFILINNDSLKWKLKPLFSGVSIEKSMYVALWISSKIWSIMVDF